MGDLDARHGALRRHETRDAGQWLDVRRRPEAEIVR
jgi:hypothetical protein